MRQRVNWGSSAQCKLIVGQHIQKVMRANIVAERKCWTVNHPYLHPVAELRRMHINVVKSKVILKAVSAATIRQLTMDHSLGLCGDFTEGGKLENPEKNPRSTGETNCNNSTHMSSKFFENRHGAIPRWSPIQL